MAANPAVVAGGAAPAESRASLRRVVAGFEQAWLRGDRPSIEDSLADAALDSGPASAYAAVELIHADLEFRLKAGEATRLEDYFPRFPALAGDRVAMVELLLTEWTVRRRTEPSLGLDEYRRRFPALADDLDALRDRQSSGRRSSGPLGPIRDAMQGADAPEPPLPSMFKRFELRERVGRGSFGRVYLAWDTFMRQRVAVKLPRRGKHASPSDVQAFLREARNASGLRHPNIVQMYEADEHDGTAYMVSEFVEGRTLAEALAADGPPPFATTAALMATVLDALHYAHEHEKRVIHRDLKPSNILLDPRGRPHVADFGLARREGDEASNIFVGERTLVGTPAYMSPEQARGEQSRDEATRQADPRSDVFSAGIVLYELLTGELPFRGRGRMLLAQIEEDDPLPPRRINDAIPPALEAICLEALAKAPPDRYRTAQAMADDLRAYLEGRAVLPRPAAAGPLRGMARAVAARPARSIALALGIAAATVGVLLLALDWLRARAEVAALRGRLDALEARQDARPGDPALPPIPAGRGHRGLEP